MDRLKVIADIFAVVGRVLVPSPANEPVKAIQQQSPVAALRLQWALLPRFERIIYAVVALWIVTMISLPLAKSAWGEAALPIGITISVLAQSAAVINILVLSWGNRRVQGVIALILPAAWLVEYVGSTTGFPFGAYHYSDRLQPQIGGVPAIVPLAWLMMLPPAWSVAYRITGGRGKTAFVVLSALAFTAWDLFLDPQMVGWGLWGWESPDAVHYFGIPLANFAGWLLASALITALALPVLRRVRLLLQPLFVIYAITWVLEAIGQFIFWGLPGPALVGFVGMGAMVWWAVKRKDPEP
jgi:putative membrane protein